MRRRPEVVNAVFDLRDGRRRVLSSSSVALIIMPFWQKPHSGVCSSIQAC